jgi:Tol biopolymer transport system component
MMRFDPSTGRAEPAPLPDGLGKDAVAVSPDGRMAAFTRTSAASEQLWIRNLITGKTEELAGGNCNNSSPAWELDSSAVIFASDCGRAFGLSALYRAPIARGAP